MVAIIDCGTNTFNLLIAGLSNDKILFHHNARIPVKLGEGGIDKNMLSGQAMERGILALEAFSKEIKNWPVQKTIAMGTAAIRDASNREEFMQQCKIRSGIEITLIDGDREAELIWKAARFCVPISGKFLVMDIGGGSNEFIIADTEKIYWKKSYRLGVSRLKETFPPDTVTGLPTNDIRAYLTEQMAELFATCHRYGIRQMTGTAGTFDTFANVFSLQDTGKEFDLLLLKYDFDTQRLNRFCTSFIQKSPGERNAIPGIPGFRKEFMVYAALLTQIVLEHCSIQRTYLSTYSLKEGIFLEQYD